MQSVRIYEMPACKMVSSGTGMFREGNFKLFDEWLSSQKRGLFPKDFLFFVLPFSELRIHGKRADKYTLQASGV